MKSENQRRWLSISLLSAIGLAIPYLSPAQTNGIFRDEGGAIFNVKAYGATGDGSTPDSASIQNAIEAATNAGGGTVYFPAGNYLINSTLMNSRADTVSLIGSGMGSILTIDSSVGLSYSPFTASNFHSGRIEHLALQCTNQATDTAIRMTDMVAAPALLDLTVSGCNTGFDLVNTNLWTERLVAINITDNYNTHLFHYDQSPSNANNSYGYGIYDGIFINKRPGQDVFYLTGGAYLYHSKFTIKGNFAQNATGAAIFNVSGGSGQQCPGAGIDTFDIAVEGSGYSVVQASNNGCSGGATGNALVEGSGTINATGATSGTNSLIRDFNSLSYFVGILTTSASPSNTLSANGANPSSQCFVQPANALAAQLGYSTYVSSVNWGSVTISHPSTAGAVYQVYCSQ